jgi:hypothetical protein
VAEPQPLFGGVVGLSGTGRWAQLLSARNARAAWPLRFEAANRLLSTTSLRRVRVSPLDIVDSDIPLCRFPYFSRELKHPAPLGRRHPLHWLVKSRRNIELDNPCHSILRCVFFRQPEKSNPDARVCVDCKWLKITERLRKPESAVSNLRKSRCKLRSLWSLGASGILLVHERGVSDVRMRCREHIPDSRNARWRDDDRRRESDRAVNGRTRALPAVRPVLGHQADSVAQSILFRFVYYDVWKLACFV